MPRSPVWFALCKAGSGSSHWKTMAPVSASIGGGGLQKLWTFRRGIFRARYRGATARAQSHRRGPSGFAGLHCGDFSYRSERLTSDRWLLAGDAAGFIDPVFSSGVFLAVLAGEQAADVLHEVLDHPKRARRLFRHYERLVNRAMDVYLRFVESWYGGKEFIEVFLTPTELFQIPPAVNAVLGGNIGNRFAIRWRMELFYLIVRLQRRWNLCPRLSLMPKSDVKRRPLTPPYMIWGESHRSWLLPSL